MMYYKILIKNYLNKLKYRQSRIKTEICFIKLVVRDYYKMLVRKYLNIMLNIKIPIQINTKMHNQFTIKQFFNQYKMSKNPFKISRLGPY